MSEETTKAWGHGLATKDAQGNVLDVWFPEPKLGPAPKTDELWVVPRNLDALVGSDPRREIETQVVRTEIDRAEPVSSTVLRAYEAEPQGNNHPPPLPPFAPRHPLAHAAFSFLQAARMQVQLHGSPCSRWPESCEPSSELLWLWLEER
jgi:hypothetical protein